MIADFLTLLVSLIAINLTRIWGIPKYPNAHARLLMISTGRIPDTMDIYPLVSPPSETILGMLLSISEEKPGVLLISAMGSATMVITMSIP